MREVYCSLRPESQEIICPTQCQHFGWIWQKPSLQSASHARRQDSMTGGRGHKQILGGTKSLILRIRECGPKKRSSSQNMRGYSLILGWRQKKDLHLKKWANFHELRGETTKNVFITKSAHKQILLTNSGVITSILGVSGLELHFIGTEPVTFFGGTILAWGHNSCLGGTCSDLGRGTAPECPPWRRACFRFTAIYRTVTIAFSLKRYCSKSVLLKKWELFKVTKRCPKPFSTIFFICENTI